MDNSGFQAKSQVFTETRAEVRLALLLLHMMKYAHLHLVIRAGDDLRGTARIELLVAGLTVPGVGEARTHSGSDLGSQLMPSPGPREWLCARLIECLLNGRVRLASMASRHIGFGR